MGAWGSGLYANDTTNDIRDSYIGYLENQLGNREAYDNILEEYGEILGGDEEPLFWYALAETQWKTGRLMPEVKQKALEWIEKGGGMELWEESSSGGAGWKKTLEKLQEKLQSPMPREKKFKQPVPVNQNPWNLGDVYAYRFHTDWSERFDFMGKYMILQKVAEGEYLKERVMCIRAYDRVFRTLPSLEDMNGLRVVPLSRPDMLTLSVGGIADNVLNFCIHAYKSKSYPIKNLTYLGNESVLEKIIVNTVCADWEGIEDWLPRCQLMWRGVEYEILDNGKIIVKE